MLTTTNGYNYMDFKFDSSANGRFAGP